MSQVFDYVLAAVRYIFGCDVSHQLWEGNKRIIPCQINTHTHTKKHAPHGFGQNLVSSYIVSLEIFAHSQFQQYILYGFRVTAKSQFFAKVQLISW